MESDRHKDLVAMLVAGGATVGGFRRGVEAAVGARFDAAPKIVPDAWGVNAATRCVYVYEVCVSHWIARKKRAAVAAWSEWLAIHGWSIRLMKLTADGMIGIDPYSGEIDYKSRMVAVARIQGGT